MSEGKKPGSSRKRKASKPQKIHTQGQSDALRVSILGPTAVPKAKMPKLRGPYPASPLDDTGYVSQGKNFSLYLPQNTLLSNPTMGFSSLPDELMSWSQDFLPNNQNCSLLNGTSSLIFSGRPVHSMSESEPDQDDIPDLVPHTEDTEDGEIVGDETDYYGVLTGRNQPLQYPDDEVTGGTTEEFHFTGGFGRGKTDFNRLESDPTYMGVGESSSSFFDKSAENILVYSQGGYSGDSFDYLDQQSSTQDESDSEEIFVEDPWQPGGPTELDLELDNVGTIAPGESDRSQPATYGQYRTQVKNHIPSVIPPAIAKQLKAVTEANVPTSDQVDVLLQAAKGRLPQGQQVKVAPLPSQDLRQFCQSNGVPNSLPAQNLPTSSPIVQPGSNHISTHTGVNPRTQASPVPSTIPKVTVARPTIQSRPAGPSLDNQSQNTQAPPPQQIAYQPPSYQFVAPPLDIPVPEEPVGLDPSSVQLNPMIEEFDIKSEEVTGASLEPSLAYVINNYFSKACTDILSLKMKDAYATLLKPRNAAHLSKIELNPEFKHPKMGISKAGILKDGHARGVQNAIIRLAVCLAQIANEILEPADPSTGPNATFLLNRAMTGLKVSAYASQRCNNFRRFLLRPHLNVCYQYICGEPITQLALLVPPNLADYIKQEKERTNRQIPLTKVGSKFLQKQKRGGGSRLVGNVSRALGADPFLGTNSHNSTNKVIKTLSYHINLPLESTLYRKVTLGIHFNPTSQITYLAVILA